jgi:prefoldin subunit 5
MGMYKAIARRLLSMVGSRYADMPERIDMIVKDIEALQTSSAEMNKFQGEIRGSIRIIQWIGAAVGVIITTVGGLGVTIVWNALISLESLKSQINMLPKTSVTENDIKLLDWRMTALEQAKAAQTQKPPDQK